MLCVDFNLSIEIINDKVTVLSLFNKSITIENNLRFVNMMSRQDQECLVPLFILCFY